MHRCKIFQILYQPSYPLDFQEKGTSREHLSLIKIIHRWRFQKNTTTYMTWRILNLHNMRKSSFQKLKLQIRMTLKFKSGIESYRHSIWKAEISFWPWENIWLIRETHTPSIMPHFLFSQGIESHHIANWLCTNIPQELNQIWTFRGWLIVLHRISLPVIAFIIISIFSFFSIFFPTGLTKSGKLNGTFKQNTSLLYSIFWYQLILTDKLEPPSICYKHNKQLQNKIIKHYGPRNQQPSEYTDYNIFFYCQMLVC